MTNEQKLTKIKLIHTGIWLFYNIVIGYLVYAVLSGRIDKWMWICLGMIVIEALILAIFKRTCPITIVARKYSNSSKENFDIFLPEWLARNNKLIYSIIVGVSLIILIARFI